MPEPVATYHASVHGVWSTEHRFRSGETDVGALRVRRNRWGLVVGGEWRPAKGEVLTVRRDPGLLRSQFSIWTEGREWLGSSLRWHFVQREVVLHTGSRPLRLLPLPGFKRGWTLQAPRTGEMARIEFPWLGRSGSVELYRKLEFELLIFSYFIGWQIRFESAWPGPAIDEDPTTVAAPPKGAG
jgi:hypothetical protein